MRFRMKTIALLFVGVVSLIANAENPAAGLYGNQRQKDSAYKPQQTSTGANPSLLPYDMRAQRLPDVGPYNGRGVYNPDSWPAPTEYIGQDGTILYCDKKGNVYDSNGVRYGKRESNGLLRKLNKSERLYDAAFSPNYADEAFKAEEREFENDNKSKKISKSSFEDETKQSDKTSLISKNQEMPRPLRREDEKWRVEPMTYQSDEEKSQERIDKAEKEYLGDKLFPDCEKIEMDNLKSKADKVAALMDWKVLEENLKERISILDEARALIRKIEGLEKEHDELVAKRSELLLHNKNKHPSDVVVSPEFNDISLQIEKVVAQAKEYASEIHNRLVPSFNSLRSKFVEACTRVDAERDAVMNTFGKNVNDPERLELAAKKTKLFMVYLDVKLKSSKPESYSRTLQTLENSIKYVGENKFIHIIPMPESNAKFK